MWLTLIIPAVQEVELGRIMVPGQLRKKDPETPSHPVFTRCGMVALACHSRYMGSINRRIQAGVCLCVGGGGGCLKNTQIEKIWTCGSSGRVPAQQPPEHLKKRALKFTLWF
jgi:hypothetical protein